MSFRSGRSLAASRRNLAMRGGGSSYCRHCGLLIADVFREDHLRVVHGILRKNGGLIQILRNDAHDHKCCHAVPRTKTLIINGREIESSE